MGYEIENYTSEELTKIPLTGKAALTLFWALPIGRWNNDELEHIWWKHFTQKTESICGMAGLIIVKELKIARKTEKQDLSANLAQILPKSKWFDSQFFDRSKDRVIERLGFERDKGLLLLSGAYPQPGWGIAIQAPKSPEDFEHILREICKQLALDTSIKKIHKINELRREIESKKATPNSVDAFEIDTLEQKYRSYADEIHPTILTNGPRFLIATEEICEKHEIPYKLTTFDGVGMASWRLSDLSYKKNWTINTLTRTFSRITQGATLKWGADRSVNHKFFKELLYQITIHNKNHSHHESAIQLLAQLEIEAPNHLDYCRTRFLTDPFNSSREAILLRSWGWHPPTTKSVRPLAMILFETSGTKFIRLNELKELWESLESFANDVRNSISQQTNHRVRHNLRSIIEELRDLNAATSISENLDKATVYFFDLTRLISNSPDSKDSIELKWSNLHSTIVNVIDDTKGLPESLPWHFIQKSTYGEHPEIIVGDAWCHTENNIKDSIRISTWAPVNKEDVYLHWNPDEYETVDLFTIEAEPSNLFAAKEIKTKRKGEVLLSQSSRSLRKNYSIDDFAPVTINIRENGDKLLAQISLKDGESFRLPLLRATRSICLLKLLLNQSMELSGNHKSSDFFELIQKVKIPERLKPELNEHFLAEDVNTYEYKKGNFTKAVSELKRHFVNAGLPPEFGESIFPRGQICWPANKIKVQF